MVCRVTPDVLPEDQRYNAKTNPTGVRCGVYDHTVNIYSKDPVTGFARRPIDDVGVQYGLASSSRSCKDCG